MKYRKFGRTGWQVGEVGCGMWAMGGQWARADDNESLRALRRAVELGCTFFDTAYAYGEGRSEKLLGQIRRENPGRKLVLATKVPPKNRVWPPQRKSKLYDTFPPAAIRTKLVDAVQVIYNIFDQAPEDALFPAAKELDVAIIARVPLDEGSLTGNLRKTSKFDKDDWRSKYFGPENLMATVIRVNRLKPLVPEGMTLPAMALRFILSNPVVSTVIPGMRKPSHVEENIRTSDGHSLPPALLEELKKHRWDRTPAPWSA